MSEYILLYTAVCMDFFLILAGAFYVMREYIYVQYTVVAFQSKLVNNCCFLIKNKLSGHTKFLIGDDCWCS